MENFFDVESMTFGFDGVSISNPTSSPDGRFTVSPKDYGFYVEHTGGGCTAWVKKLENGYLVLTDDNLNHELGETGSAFVMCYYDGDEGDDSECLWGNCIACTDLIVGHPPEYDISDEGSIVDHATMCKVINGVYKCIDRHINKTEALKLVDLFKKIDLANT